MAKKGGLVKKSTEVIYKFARNKSFRADIQKVREVAGIPAGGFEDEYEENVQAVLNYTPTLIVCIDLLKKYKLPVSYYWEMNQYIRFNRLDRERSAEQLIMTIKYPNDIEHSSGSEEVFRKFGEAYVALYIHDASGKENVIKIINKNWKLIRRSLRSQGANVSRIRKSDNKWRNLQILELWEKSKAELCAMEKMNMSECAHIRKESIIVRIMNKLGFSEVSSDMVRKYSANTVANLSTDNSKVKRSIGNHHK